MEDYFEIKQQYLGYLNIGYQENVLKRMRECNCFLEINELLDIKEQGLIVSIKKRVLSVYLQARAQYFIDLAIGFNTFAIPIPRDLRTTSDELKYYCQEMKKDLEEISRGEKSPHSYTFAGSAEIQINRLLDMLLCFKDER